MKANDGSGNIPERDTWETPQELFNTLNNQYTFFLDCCANENNSKCPKFCVDFLESYLDWKGDNMVAWMNPPFSKAREMFEHFFKVVTKGVAIYRCDNLETSIWQEVILKNADWIFIPKGRICYEGMEGKGSRFPSALIGKGVDLPNHLDGFALKVVRKR